MSEIENVKEGTGKGEVNYELAFHIVPSHDENSAKQVFDAVLKLIEDKGGKVINKSTPVLLNLIYQMEKVVDSVKSKYNQAYFAWIIFGSNDVETIKHELDQNTELLRYLIIKTNQTDGKSAQEVASMLNGEEESKQEEKVEEKPVEEDLNAEESSDASEDSAKVDEESDIANKVDEAIEELVK